MKAFAIILSDAAAAEVEKYARENARTPQGVVAGAFNFGMHCGFDSGDEERMFLLAVSVAETPPVAFSSDYEAAERRATCIPMP